MKNEKRREFTRNLLLGLAATPALGMVKLHAEEAMEPAETNKESGIVINNPHGHILNIPLIDLLNLSLSQKELTYDIQGNSSHAHSVVVTLENLEELAANSEVILTSTLDRGHEHTIKLTLGEVNS